MRQVQNGTGPRSLCILVALPIGHERLVLPRTENRLLSTRHARLNQGTGDTNAEFTGTGRYVQKWIGALRERPIVSIVQFRSSDRQLLRTQSFLCNMRIDSEKAWPDRFATSLPNLLNTISTRWIKCGIIPSRTNRIRGMTPRVVILMI